MESLGTELATEERPTESIDEHASGSTLPVMKACKNHPGLAAIDKVVILIAEDGASVAHRHRCCIGIRPTDLAARDALA